ncbi:DUF4360 domain-containing protein [Amycolatopsis keratiniphila]|nr:DUF4360 domain-containing protein [Amycolatopsis keratiniphila]
MLNAVVAAVSLFSSIITPNSMSPPPGPPPDRVVIDVVTVNGSGCPPGSSAVAVARDNTSFTVTYSEYTAQVGVGSKPTDFRKNCQLNLNIHVPQGFTYGIASADYRGFASLEAGAKALQRANYYFQGNSPTAQVSHPVNGPISDNWQFRDEAEGGVIIYKPCGEDRNLNVNTELRVGAGSSDPKKTTSFITMDSTDGAFKTTYHFSWKTCPTS